MEEAEKRNKSIRGCARIDVASDASGAELARGTPDLLLPWVPEPVSFAGPRILAWSSWGRERKPSLDSPGRRSDGAPDRAPRAGTFQKARNGVCGDMAGLGKWTWTRQIGLICIILRVAWSPGLRISCC